jgi:menaquinol-cytochrome c reductase iron-sulfur subunit
MVGTDNEHGRRRFLSRIITAVQVAIGGTLGVIFGGAAVGPALAGRDGAWLPASPIGDLPMDIPTPVVVGIPRRDGYTQVVEQRTVFLVRTGASDVRALDSTCTHLGCRVSWDSEYQELRCPCHGGVYDKTGAVKAGPPPAPLATLATRVDSGRVLVRL